MRTSLMAIIVMTLLSTSLFAQSKIGVINSSAILATHPSTQAAETKLRAKMELWKKQGEQKEKDLMKMQQDFQAQAMLLSADQKRAKETEFQKAAQELQMWGQKKEQEGRELQQQLLKPITDEVNAIIIQIAKAKSYDIVFDENGSIVYATEGVNLTDAVLAKMKK